MKIQYGLTEGIIELTAWVMGKSKMPFVAFREDGDWRPYTPKYENQTTKLGHETNACTVYGAQTQIEILEKFLYGKEPNYAERFNYNLIPIDPKKGGVDPHITYNNIEDCGLVDQKYLPMTDTLEEYMDKSEITGSLKAKGLYWRKQNDFQHEELWKRGGRPQNYKQLIREALTTCPIALSVDAWILGPDGKYISDGDGRNTHWFCALYMEPDNSIIGIDTYDFYIKTLHPDHDIRIAKRIWLNRRTKSASKSMIQLLQEVIKRLSMKPTIASEVEKVLGLDVTPRDDTSDSVACVDVITTILKPFGVPHMVSTIEFDKWLSNPKNGFTKTTQFEEGVIVSSPTEGPRVGHVGVCVNVNGVLLIASNNSFGPNSGKITANYTPDLWFRKFVIEKKLKMNMYKHG